MGMKACIEIKKVQVEALKAKYTEAGKWKNI
jgi:hypothetical protein